MLTIADKKNFVAQYNLHNKTCYQYDFKTDTVIQEFNSKSFPRKFDDWKASVTAATV